MPRCSDTSSDSDKGSEASDSDRGQDGAAEFPSTAAPTPPSGASTVVFQQVRLCYPPSLS